MKKLLTILSILIIVSCNHKVAETSVYEPSVITGDSVILMPLPKGYKLYQNWKNDNRKVDYSRVDAIDGADKKRK